MRGIPEIMFCRIFLFMWSVWALNMHPGLGSMAISYLGHFAPVRFGGPGIIKHADLQLWPGTR